MGYQSREVLTAHCKRAQIEADDSRGAQHAKLRRQLVLLEGDHHRLCEAELKHEEQLARDDAAHKKETAAMEGRLQTVMANVMAEEHALAAAQDVATALAAETQEQWKQEREAKNHRDGLARYGASAQDENLKMLTLSDKLFEEMADEQHSEKHLEEETLQLQRVLEAKEASQVAVLEELQSLDQKAASEVRMLEEAQEQEKRLREDLQGTETELERYRESDAEANALKLEVAELNGQLDLILGHKVLKEKRRKAADGSNRPPRSTGR